MDEVVASQPPPATDAGVPWGSFYTAPSNGSAQPKTTKKVKAKKTKKAKKANRGKGSVDPMKGGADPLQGTAVDPTQGAVPPVPGAAEPMPGAVAPMPGAPVEGSAAPAAEGETVERRSRSRGRRATDKRRSFEFLRRSPREDRGAIAPAPAPVATAAKSRRYAEPHVLVGIVGGTIIALAALLIALLYMIGTAA